MSIRRKLDLFLAVCLFIFSCLLVDYRGIEFPQKSELQYYTGTLNILKTRAGDYDSRATNKHIAFYDKKTKVIYEFSCAYSAIDSDYNSCGSDDDFAPYIGKIVIIGWYEQKKFLWIENKRKQMVTLKTKDEVIRSYEDTSAKIKSHQKFRRKYIIFMLLVSTLMYWLLGKLNQKSVILTKTK